MVLKHWIMQVKNIIVLAVMIFAVATVSENGVLEAGLSMRGQGKGPLMVHPSNPRYFTDSSGRAIYLTGSHTWANLQDRGYWDPPPRFDYEAYLNWMQRHNHNLIRLWVWESAAWVPWTEEDYYFDPMPYERTGPGRALDGKPKFDLRRFNPAYFERLRSRVMAAHDRGIYVSIMLFQGWSIEKKEPWADKNNPWRGHPFNKDNNVNRVDGDANGDGEGHEVHTLQNPVVTVLQEAYVRKVIDTANDLDNVLYEISNESHGGSAAWQKHMIDYIHSYEATKQKQHAVLYTAAWGLDGSELWATRAEAVSPGWPGPGVSFVPYRDDPPANDGSKVVINDTDHLWGLGGNRGWVWKTFLRGLHPIFMDPYDGVPGDPPPFDPKWDLIRRNMGYTLTYAKKTNLAAMTPREDLCSSRFCLANPGREYIIYLPSIKRTFGMRTLDRLGIHEWVGWLTRLTGWNETVTVDLPATTSTFRVEWLNPRTGGIVAGAMIKGGGQKEFTAPFQGDAVLYIVSTNHNL